MKSGLAGFFYDALNPVDQCGRSGRVIARDVVQRHIAKTAFLPIATVRHSKLVPAPVAPQSVHGVEHVEQRQIRVQR